MSRLEICAESGYATSTADALPLAAPQSPLVVEVEAVSAADRLQDENLDFERSLQTLQEQALLPIIEDLADWLAQIFGLFGCGLGFTLAVFVLVVCGP